MACMIYICRWTISFQTSDSWMISWWLGNYEWWTEMKLALVCMSISVYFHLTFIYMYDYYFYKWRGIWYYTAIYRRYWSQFWHKRGQKPDCLIVKNKHAELSSHGCKIKMVTPALFMCGSMWNIKPTLWQTRTLCLFFLKLFPTRAAIQETMAFKLTEQLLEMN